MSNTVGARLKAARVKHGFSQAELAKAVGVSQAAIGQWERDQFLPRGKHINALRNILNLQLHLIDTDSEAVSTEGGASLGGEIDLHARSQSNLSNIAGHGTLDHPAGISGTYDVRSRWRQFREEIADILRNADARTKTNTIIEGPNNRKWVVDISTTATATLLVDPGSWNGIDQSIASALWRLAVLREILGRKLTYVVIVREPSYPANLNDTAADQLIYMQRRYYDFVEDSDLMGLHLIMTKTSEQAAHLLSKLNTNSR